MTIQDYVRFALELQLRRGESYVDPIGQGTVRIARLMRWDAERTLGKRP